MLAHERLAGGEEPGFDCEPSLEERVSRFCTDLIRAVMNQTLARWVLDHKHTATASDGKSIGVIRVQGQK